MTNLWLKFLIPNLCILISTAVFFFLYGRVHYQKEIVSKLFTPDKCCRYENQTGETGGLKLLLSTEWLVVTFGVVTMREAIDNYDKIAEEKLQEVKDAEGK